MQQICSFMEVNTMDVVLKLGYVYSTWTQWSVLKCLTSSVSPSCQVVMQFWVLVPSHQRAAMKCLWRRPYTDRNCDQALDSSQSGWSLMAPHESYRSLISPNRCVSLHVFWGWHLVQNKCVFCVRYWKQWKVSSCTAVCLVRRMKIIVTLHEVILHNMFCFQHK